MSLGRSLQWLKISHIFRMRSTNFSLVYSWSTVARITNMPVTSSLKALGGCSSHYLQGAGAYCGSCTTACTVVTSCNKKASYHKQITRQHLSQIIWEARAIPFGWERGGWPLEIPFPHVTMLNLGQTVWVYVGVSKIWGCWGFAPWDEEWLTP